MTNALREAVRRAYQHRCGYCGVHENEAGCELEIDHFRPVSKGGGDESENLVYCCTACNRHKADFWPTAENPWRRNNACSIRSKTITRFISAKNPTADWQPSLRREFFTLRVYTLTVSRS